MILIRATLALAMCVIAAGCQHDARLQAHDLPGRVAAMKQEAKLPPLAPDARWARRDAPAQRVIGAADNNPLLFYLSTPLGASEGARFSHSSFVVRSGDRMKAFAGPFEPLPTYLPGEIVREMETEDATPDAPVATNRATSAMASRPAPAVTERSEYAQALWNHLYRVDVPAPERYAATRSSASATAAEED